MKAMTVLPALVLAALAIWGASQSTPATAHPQTATCQSAHTCEL